MTVGWLPGLCCPCSQVPKVPKLLPPAYQLQFSADSDSLFVASARGSVHVLQLLEPGGCKHLHTLRPPSGVGWGELGWCWGFLGSASSSPVGAGGGVPLSCPEGHVSLSWGCLCPDGLALDNRGTWGWVSLGSLGLPAPLSAQGSLQAAPRPFTCWHRARMGTGWQPSAATGPSTSTT